MDSYKSLGTLHFFLRIFSLHHISYKSQQGFISTPWSHIKVIIMLFVFGSLPSYNLYLHYSSGLMSTISPSVVVVDMIDSILCYFNYIVDLYFVYKYRNKMCAYYYNYDQMDAVFKIKYIKDIKIYVTTLVVIFLSSWFMASVGQFTVWASAGGWLSSSTYAFSYFTLLIRFLTALDFVAQTIHMRLRLKCITEHIEEYASFCESSSNRVKTVENKTGKGNKSMPCISEYRCEIGKASSCYLLLITQAKFLNKFFGVRMLMHCLYSLVEMITHVNMAARVISGAMSTVISSYVFFAPNILRFINGVAVLTMLVYYSEACCQECGELIDATDRLLVNKIISDEIKSSLKTLRKLVKSRSLKFSAAGFFNLESTLLLSVASVVITYAVVIVQSTQ